MLIINLWLTKYENILTEKFRDYEKKPQVIIRAIRSKHIVNVSEIQIYWFSNNSSIFSIHITPQ